MKTVAEDPQASWRFMTPSNMLSILRGLLVIPFAIVMLSDRPDARLWGIVLLGVAALTDKLDGVLARRLHEITEWGKILDPLADKVGVGVGAVVLLVRGDIPLWFVELLVGRDLLILLGGIVLKASRGVVLSSNVTGKWAIAVVSVVLVLAVVGARSVVTDLITYIAALMLVVSLVVYAVRFWKTYRKSADYGIA